MIMLFMMMIIGFFPPADLSLLLDSSVPVNQDAQYQDQETDSAKWDSAILDVITNISAFPTVTCQHVFFVRKA